MNDKQISPMIIEAAINAHRQFERNQYYWYQQAQEFFKTENQKLIEHLNEVLKERFGLKQPTQFEKSLKQRQEVWGYFKNGAPGIDADGPYILDKRDVWYMRHESEQHAGYAWQEYGKTFVPVDLCYICNELADIEVLNECPVCFAPVCCDCSCGCNEPGYSEEVLDFNPADPRNDKAWVERECKKIERECKKIEDLAINYGGGIETFKRGTKVEKLPPFEMPMYFETLNELRQQILDAFSIGPNQLWQDTGVKLESDLVWDVVCEKCQRVWHLPQPKGATVGFDFLCDCGNPMSFTAGDF